MPLVQFAIEEKVIERAYKKLALDAMVIQQGRLAESRGKQKKRFLLSFLFALPQARHARTSTTTFVLLVHDPFMSRILRILSRRLLQIRACRASPKLPQGWAVCHKRQIS